MKAYLRVITSSINIKICGKIGFVFALLIAIVVFSFASKGGSYVHVMDTI